VLACAGRSEFTPPGGGGNGSSAGSAGSGTGGASAGSGTGGADQSTLPVCLRPAESGPCNAYFERFAFDPETLSCRTFVYGGCGDNGNNFQTAAECEATCVSEYAQCDPISRGAGCPCNDARDCAFGSCSNAIYELTMDGYRDCPPSPIGICTGGGAESCTCPIQGGQAFCAP
jgi:hypothetical protein